LTGEETQNLVPVDWVSGALLELLRRPHWHGRTYHLVARQPARLHEIKSIIEDLLHIEGIQWVGRDGLADPTSLEQLVVDQFQDYWSYLQSDLVFDCRNTRQALPDLPPPSFDRALVIRLLHFAQENNWGRERTRGHAAQTLDLAHYLEQVLPMQVRQSPVARALPRGLCFAIDLDGPGGGQWTCCCADRALHVQRGFDSEAALTYSMDASTFAALVRGRQTARQAFFDGRIEIRGNKEKGLMLAILIEQFLLERPDGRAREREALHAVAGC
jgi:hypothetical protein